VRTTTPAKIPVDGRIPRASGGKRKESAGLPNQNGGTRHKPHEHNPPLFNRPALNDSGVVREANLTAKDAARWKASGRDKDPLKRAVLTDNQVPPQKEYYRWNQIPETIDATNMPEVFKTMTRIPVESTLGCCAVRDEFDTKTIMLHQERHPFFTPMLGAVAPNGLKFMAVYKWIKKHQHYTRMGSRVSDNAATSPGHVVLYLSTQTNGVKSVKALQDSRLLNYVHNGAFPAENEVDHLRQCDCDHPDLTRSCAAGFNKEADSHTRNDTSGKSHRRTSAKRMRAATTSANTTKKRATDNRPPQPPNYPFSAEAPTGKPAVPPPIESAQTDISEGDLVEVQAKTFGKVHRLLNDHCV
jgi:hypothetical protein